MNEVREWIDALDAPAHDRIVQALVALAEGGPGLGRPLVDSITHSSIANLEELRPGTIRILFVFAPWRSTILLVAATRPGAGKPGTGKPSHSPNNAMRPT